MEENSGLPAVSKEALWHLDNYILIRDYYDRTISRIAARCVRMGNIAVEEYPHYSYILDVLEEISDTGDYILQHKELYPYVEKKIAGGIEALKKNLKEYQQELTNNSSPDMIKEDALEVEKMKEALGGIDKSVDPTVGAGMNMEALMEKLMSENKTPAQEASEAPKPQAQSQAQPSASVLTPAPVPTQTPAQQQPRPQSVLSGGEATQVQPVPASQPKSQSVLSQPTAPAQPQAPQQSVLQGEIKKIIKIKKPIIGTAQAVPNKEEVEQ